MAYQDKEKSLECLIGLINTYFTKYLSVIYFNIIKVTWKIRKKPLKTKYKQSYSNKENKATKFLVPSLKMGVKSFQLKFWNKLNKISYLVIKQLVSTIQQKREYTFEYQITSIIKTKKNQNIFGRHFNSILWSFFHLGIKS